MGPGPHSLFMEESYMTKNTASALVQKPFIIIKMQNYLYKKWQVIGTCLP